MAPKDKSTRSHLTLDREILDAQEAARYCGFKTPSGLRKARLRGQVTPFGRRGQGTWLYTRAELDRFLGRGGTGTVAEERAGTPPQGNADNAREVHPPVQHLVGGDETPRNLQIEERRIPRSNPHDGPLQPQGEGGAEGSAARDDRAGDGLASGGEGTAAVAPRPGGSAESLLRYIR